MPSVMTCDRSMTRRVPSSASVIASLSKQNLVPFVVGAHPDPAGPTAPLGEAEFAEEGLQAGIGRDPDVHPLQPKVGGLPEQPAGQLGAEAGPAVLRVDQDQLEVAGVPGAAASRPQEPDPDQPACPVRRHGEQPAGLDLVNQTGRPGGDIGSEHGRREPDRRPGLRATGCHSVTRATPNALSDAHTAARAHPVDPVEPGGVGLGRPSPHADAAPLPSRLQSQVREPQPDLPGRGFR